MSGPGRRGGEASPTMRARLEAGENLIGIINDFIDPAVIETAAYAGFDFVVLEYEHNLRDWETIAHLIRTADAANVDVIVRLGTLETNVISRVLEAGPTGLMLAHVKTREDAETIVQAAHYPPDGVRGQGYPRRGRLWKLGNDSAAADARSNRETILIAQVEDIEGVENIEEILDVPGLTGVAPGPADLAASMGNLALDAPEVNAALETVRAAVRKRDDKFALGLLTDPAAAPALRDSGTQLLMYNHDIILVGDYFESIVEGARRHLGG